MKYINSIDINWVKDINSFINIVVYIPYNIFREF